MTNILLGYISYFAVICITRSAVLAKNMRELFFEDNYKLAFRRLAWYLQRSFTSFEIIRDDFFNFTEQCSDQECAELKEFIAFRKDKMGRKNYLLDLLYIKAVTIHRRIESNNDDVRSLIKSFYTDANKLLKETTKETKEIKKSYFKSRAGSSKQFKNNAKLALEHFSKMLPNEKWTWFVISGTFLGLYRESDFLEHDFDIDLGIYNDQVCIDEMIEEIRLNQQFYINKIYFNLEIIKNHDDSYTAIKRITHIKLIHIAGINIDLFVHYKEDGFCWHGSVLHRWENSIFSLKKYTLSDVTVFGPKEAELYLIETYGNWKTPIVEYNAIVDSPNLAITRNFLSFMLFLKKISFLLESDIKSANNLIALLEKKSVLSVNKDSSISLNEYI